jgi:hypothetical protein
MQDKMGRDFRFVVTRLDLGLQMSKAPRAVLKNYWIIEYDSTTLCDIGSGHLTAGLQSGNGTSG